MNAPRRAATWLSRDLATLAGELPRFAAEDPAGFHFDVVIVGSGYGGGMALQALAGYGTKDGKPLRIAMLERGKEYLPGAFPSRMSELPGHVRFSVKGQPKARGRETGLFDLRLGPDMGVVLANGLGGGSLINAGVLAEPLKEVFTEKAWPEEIQKDGSLPALMTVLKKQLGADKPLVSPPQRTAAVNKLAPSRASLVTVATQDDPLRGINACIGCGDCATGCNFGAKLSIDVGPIAETVRTHDEKCLRVVTGATVNTFCAHGPGWQLTVEHTDPAVRRRECRPYKVLARHLVICAGTLGSTELLMRASRGGLELSKGQLGQHFSGNGDNIVLLHDTQAPTQSVADEDQPFKLRGHGPTITRTIDLRHGKHPMVIQDLGIPGALRRLIMEVAALGHTMESLVEFDDSVHRDGQAPAPRPETLSDARIDNSLAMAVIVRDAADGKLALQHGADVGTLAVEWRKAQQAPELDVFHDAVAELARKGHPTARVLASPGWRPLPPDVEALVGTTRGPLVTVHPLGGCCMADSAAAGVVNHLGQVFSDQTGKKVYEHLAVLDGAIVPTSLGINPSLTIAALAQRAACQLRELWGFQPVDVKPAKPGVRPVFRTMPDARPNPPTQFQITERMVAEARLGGKEGVACKVTIELWSHPFTLESIAFEGSRRRIRIDSARSRLRVYRKAPELPQDDLMVSAQAAQTAIARDTELLEASLEGSMRLFTHRPTSGPQRTVRAFVAYVFNRGLRDGVQPAAKVQGRAAASFLRRVGLGLRLASRAGDERQIEYRLKVRKQGKADAVLEEIDIAGQSIALTKVITYERAANPTVQLMHARIDQFPDMRALRLTSKLSVDLPYFGEAGFPLLRIHKQHDHASALIDTASLLAYIGRTLLPLHAWTFRRPDLPTRPLPPEPRLPKDICGLEPSKRIDVPLGNGLKALLTYYPRLRRSSPQPRPVLMIHGYSASGTTFAHEALPGGGLVGELCRRGHDAWVLDLRSSSGLPTGDRLWTFEDMGCEDIPAAIDHIHRHYGGTTQVDVVAHCMGAAMLSLGLFGEWPDRGAFRTERAAMPQRIGRLVLSQVGPALVMSPANTARAYAVQWLRQYFPMGAFAFRPSEKPTTAEQLLDRLLCAVPYRREDFFVENPLWPWKKTPWVAQRHRMDALYGVTFDVSGVDAKVLDRIDEFFGPMNMDTAAQTIWFARSKVVTDRNGEACVTLPHRMQAIAHCPVLALHAEQNGLVDVSTRKALLDVFWPQVIQGRSRLLRGMGHQDTLIGRKAPVVYRYIAEFLEG